MLPAGSAPSPGFGGSSPPPPAVSRRSSFECRASLSESESSVAGEPSSSSSSSAAVLSDEVVGEATGTGDADEALRIIAGKAGGRGGVVGVSDCCSNMAAALERDNAGLALSVFYAMRSTFDQGRGNEYAWFGGGSLEIQLEWGGDHLNCVTVNLMFTYVDRWRWSRPDVRLYTHC